MWRKYHMATSTLESRVGDDDATPIGRRSGPAIVPIRHADRILQLGRQRMAAVSDKGGPMDVQEAVQELAKRVGESSPASEWSVGQVEDSATIRQQRLQPGWLTAPMESEADALLAVADLIAMGMRLDPRSTGSGTDVFTHNASR
jgi:hypothetical protein